MPNNIVKKTETITTLGGQKVDVQSETSLTTGIAQLGNMPFPVVSYYYRFSGGSDAFSTIIPLLHNIEIISPVLSVVFVLTGHLFLSIASFVIFALCLIIPVIYWLSTRNKPQLNAQLISPVQFHKGDKKHMLPINEEYENKQPLIIKGSGTRTKQHKVKTPVQP